MFEVEVQWFMEKVDVWWRRSVFDAEGRCLMEKVGV